MFLNESQHRILKEASNFESGGEREMLDNKLFSRVSHPDGVNRCLYTKFWDSILTLHPATRVSLALLGHPVFHINHEEFRGDWKNQPRK